jgi:hypothetical protein
MRLGESRLVRLIWALAAVGLSRSAFAADEIHWTITGQTSVTFDWRGTASENVIVYGLSAGLYTSTVTASNPTGVCVPWSSIGPFWEAKLTGLTANTLYHYSIASGPDHTFRTPPPPGSTSFDILVEGDVGDSISYHRMGVVQQLMAEETSARFALVVGDISYANTNGQAAVDQHFNDVMSWSLDAAYMPAWGNHEWDSEPADDLRNYKGRFDFVNPHTSPGTPPTSDCGEDWYWFDYGHVRFIAYPEPWTGAWADWNPQAVALMDAAQADPNVTFIVTFGHRPAYSSGNHPGSGTLKGYLDALAATHSKYVLNLDGHSHDYERTFPQNGSGDNLHGAMHVTVGTGGGTLETSPGCPWLICSQPTWSATRYFHFGYLKLSFSPTSITGSFICGPAGPNDDVICTQGTVLDSFVIGPGCNDPDGDGYGNPGSTGCPMGSATDCNNNDPTIYPGAPQMCDGKNNSCTAPGWPNLAGTNEFDNDGDGTSACAGDCDDTDAATHPGATEINDGKDNQCVGSQGYGLIDETSGVSGFTSAVNPKTEYSWPAQQGATSWEVARAVSPDFSAGCGTVATTVPLWNDPEVPAPGQAFYYLNRPLAPFVGSWGAHSSGVEWAAVCPATGSTSFTAGVTASSDDAEETDTGSMRLTSGDLDLTLDGSYQTVGIRFNGLPIPRGARIANAYVQFEVRDATSSPTSLKIQGQSDDNAPTFAATTGNISSRSRTAAFATWSPPAWTSSGAAGPDQRTPNFATVVKEIVNRQGWTSGNSIVLIITGTGDRSAKAWDNDLVNHVGVPVLHVDFDDGGP